MRQFVLLSFILTGAITVASAQMTAQLYLSKEKAEVGETVEVKCHFTSRHGVPTYVLWLRRVGDQDMDIEETEIASNRFINAPFSETNRYKVSMVFDRDLPEDRPQVLDYTLTISNVQPSDSGEIGCLLPANNVNVFKKFAVFSPVTEVMMSSSDLAGTHNLNHSDGQNVTFEEGEKRKFTCWVRGSYPAPEVTITVGKRDITELFVKEDKLMSEGDTPGLKALTYDTTLSTDSLEISYEFNNQKLQCQAVVPDSPYDPVSKFIVVNLNGFSPKFECGNAHYAKLHETNVQIKCLVKADPAAVDFYWREKSGNTSLSLSPGESTGHFTLLVEDGENSNEHVMTLVIDRVFWPHFGEYAFGAENELGRTEHRFFLKSESWDTDESTRIGVSLLLTLVLCLVSLL